MTLAYSNTTVPAENSENSLEKLLQNLENIRGYAKDSEANKNPFSKVFSGILDIQYKKIQKLFPQIRYSQESIQSFPDLYETLDNITFQAQETLDLNTNPLDISGEIAHIQNIFPESILYQNGPHILTFQHLGYNVEINLSGKTPITVNHLPTELSYHGKTSSLHTLEIFLQDSYIEKSYQNSKEEVLHVSPLSQEKQRFIEEALQYIKNISDDPHHNNRANFPALKTELNAIEQTILSIRSHEPPHLNSLKKLPSQIQVLYQKSLGLKKDNKNLKHPHPSEKYQKSSFVQSMKYKLRNMISLSQKAA